MYSIGKNVKIMQLLGRCFRMLLILGSMVICIEGCSKDDENQENDPPPKKTPSEGVIRQIEQDTLIVSPDFLSNV